MSVEFKQQKHGAIIIADTFEELKNFVSDLNKDFPENKYKFSDYTEKNGKHMAVYYIDHLK